MGSTKKREKEKPLDKMTIKEIREIALAIPGIVGAHGMNKVELISKIKKSKGIKDTGVVKDSNLLRSLKGKIKESKLVYENMKKEGNLEKAKIYKRRISRLKKRTRKAS
jgi:hypothetical protein